MPAPTGLLGSEMSRKPRRFPAAPETASAAAAPAIVGRARWVRRGSSTVVLIRLGIVPVGVDGLVVPML
ncbi:hypothetical protein AXF14_06015 [Actinomyces radicidentis]|uniref:Uncharacterized protein n=1 Tax=Actinomyces radicidentis TaxID=111015 RepID=A0A0X8JET5_ACTRD|nr:hypothetical protein AXF14_06015 [Actinomyces radicidentis]